MVPEKTRQTEFLSFMTIFLLFQPPDQPEIRNFEKMKKKKKRTPGDIII